MRANAGTRGLDYEVATMAKAGAASLADGRVWFINLTALLADYTGHELYSINVFPTISHTYLTDSISGI
jgi:hypothetical protein